MRYTLFVFALMVFGTPSAAQVQDPKTNISRVLDDFHDAASKADGQRYFGHFANNAVFLGTDITERWTVEQFKSYATPHFEKGQGWTYRTKSRHVELAEDGQTAWFDEVLLNDKFGETRGSGVLIKAGDTWKLSQYHLTLPVPNDLMLQVVELIKKQSPSAPK